MVYLQELEFDLGINEDLVSFSQVIESVNSNKRRVEIYGS